MSVNEDNTIYALLEFFRSEAESYPQKSRANYLKAIASLERFAEGGDDTSLSDELLDGWIGAMLRNEYALSVAVHYLNAISALYGKAVKRGIASDELDFKGFKERLNALADLDFDYDRRRANLKSFQSIMRNAESLSTMDRLCADLVLTAVLNPGLGLRKTARLTKAEAAELSAVSKAATDRHLSTKRKYIFPLGQSEKTDRQLDKFIETIVADFFSRNNISLTDNGLQDTVNDLFVTAALQCGYAPKQITELLSPDIPANPILHWRQASAEKAGKDEIREGVSTLLLNNPSHWYALRIRKGVKYEAVEEKIGKYAGRNGKPTLYYPCAEIAKRTGRKIELKERPLLPDIVFVRTHMSEITALVQAASDLVWCYTTSGRPGSPYAVISDRSMDFFQRAIGIFSKDTEIGPIGTLLPRPGEQVLIIGGDFAGHRAEVEKVVSFSSKYPRNTDISGRETNTAICRLCIHNDNGIEWRLNMDSRLLQYQTL